MKVYTKTGDKGTTALLGGVRVPKNHIRIEAYGTVDELNSGIGLIRANNIGEELNEILVEIQTMLFYLGSELATPADKMVLANGKPRLPKVVQEQNINQIENWIDRMEEELPPLRHFILPGGDYGSSHAHMCRCICRRAERICVSLSELEQIREEPVKYLNRLSDFFFVLARKIAHDAGHQEIQWLPEYE